MKASIRFRDDRRPLVHAKVPLTILGLPFSSAISAGDAAELQLDFATAFSAGPALRFSYRPNDPADPFRVAVRTGAGALGSPVGGTPMSMSAEFSVLPHGGSPRFMLTFKPRLGDFGVRRVAVSEEELVRGMRARGRAVQMQPLVIGSLGVGDAEGHDAAGGGGEGGIATEDQSAPGANAVGGSGVGWKANGYVAAAKSAATYPARAVDRLLSGTEITARTLLPLRSRALVKVRWGVRVPSELRCAAFADDDVIFGGGKRRLGVPFLVMSKLSIEHVTNEDHQGAQNHKGLPAGNDLAEACFSVRKQLEALREENGMLRKAVDALRMDFAGRKERGAGQDGRVALGNARGGGGGGTGREEELRSGGGRKPAPTTPATPPTPPKNGRRGGAAVSKEPLAATTKDEVNEELRKALMDATSAGIN